MGYIKHHAIVVSCFDDHSANQARKAAIHHQLEPTPTHLGSNGTCSFAILPDGSKEGWETSNQFDLRRQAFKTYLSQAGQEWVEVSYGGDTEKAEIEDECFRGSRSLEEKRERLTRSIAMLQAELIALDSDPADGMVAVEALHGRRLETQPKVEV